jgi:glutathione S-transferase
MKVRDGALAGKQYLLGDDFTVADLNVTSALRVGKLVGLDLSANPTESSWPQKCFRRPANANVRTLRWVRAGFRNDDWSGKPSPT